MNEWRWPKPKEVFVGIILIILVKANCSVWNNAMSDPRRIVTSEPKKIYNHCWRVGGMNRWAEAISTSAPNYMGTKGFTVVGYNETGSMIWSVDGCTELEQIK